MIVRKFIPSILTNTTEFTTLFLINDPRRHLRYRKRRRYLTHRR